MNKKDKELSDKINNLLGKLETEGNSLKRGIYTARLNFLIARLQKEIEIINIKKDYQDKRNKLEEEIKNQKATNTSGKSEALQNEEYIEIELKQCSKYDSKSPDFLFKEELDDVEGDVDKLIKQLEEQQHYDLANRIGDAKKKREEYEDVKNQIDKLKETGKEIRKEAKLKKRKSRKDETSLIINKKIKGNIVTRLINAIKKGWGELTRTSKIKKGLKQEFIDSNNKNEKHVKKQLKEIEDERNTKLKDLQNKYDMELKKLKEQYKKDIEKKKKKYADEKYFVKKTRTNVRRKYKKAEEEKFKDKLKDEQATKKIEEVVKEWQEKITQDQGQEGQDVDVENDDRS